MIHQLSMRVANGSLSVSKVSWLIASLICIFAAPAAPAANEPWAHAPSQKEPATPGMCTTCQMPEGPVLPDSIYPTYLHSGEFYYTAEDLRISGRGMDLVWSRVYGSTTGSVTAQGHGWDFSYNISISQSGPGLIVANGWGRETLYLPAGAATWTTSDYLREITIVSGQHVLTFPNGGTWTFLPLDGSPAEGKIAAITDRNFNTIQFSYDAAGRVSVITDTLGRPLTVSYTSAGQVSLITDFTGRQVIYGYSPAGDLVAVRSPIVTGTPHSNDFPAGKLIQYTYSSGFADNRLNHNLLTVTDPSGQTVLTNTYALTTDPGNHDFDRVSRIVWGDAGDIIDIVYVPQTPSTQNHMAVVKAIVNDRVGNVREFFYDAAGRGVVFDFYTGRANPDQPTTDSANRPMNPLRATDPALFRTTYSYNKDSLIAAIAYPNLSEVQMTYDDLNPIRRAQGNMTEQRRLPGPLGGDQPELVERFEYAPGMGGCCGANFVTRHTDARGHDTVHTYDARGNRLTTTHRDPAITEAWSYNTFGQITRHILPDNAGCRRVDLWDYYASGPQTGYLKRTIIDASDALACAGTHLNLTTTYEYDARGNVTRTIDPRGFDTLVQYNHLDQVVRVLSAPAAGGKRIERLYFYDLNDNRVREDIENRDETGALQSNTHISTITDYETLDEPSSICQEHGDAPLPLNVLSTASIPPAMALQFSTTRYTYDANRNRTHELAGEAVAGAQPDNVVETSYDERDMVFRVIQGAGGPDHSTTQYDYNANGNLVRTAVGIESVPAITTNVFDGFDRRIATTTPMGSITEFHYDPNGNVGGNKSENPVVPNPFGSRRSGELSDVPGSAQNIRLAEQMTVYDFMDRAVRDDDRHFDTYSQTNIGDGQSTTTKVYSNTSQLLSVTNDNGNTSTTAYDSANRTSLVTDAAGNTVGYSYDANSNLVSVLERDLSEDSDVAEEFITGFTFDALNRALTLTDSALNVRSNAYDSRDNNVLTIDAEGRRVRSVFDGLSRLVSTSIDMDGNDAFGDPSDITTSQQWDRTSRIVGQTDGAGNVTRTHFDGLGRITRLTFADSTVTQYKYDIRGNRVQVIDPNQSVITTIYDVANRPIARTITRGPNVHGTTTESFKYDGLSRVIVASDDDSRVTRGSETSSGYDSLSLLIRETQQLLPAGPVRTVSYAHDGAGNTTRIVYPGGRVVDTTYDFLERKRTITDTNAGVQLARYRYAGAYRVKRLDRANGTRTVYDHNGIVGLPNALNDRGVKRVVRTLHTNSFTNNIIDDRTFLWDADGNKKQRRDIRSGGPKLIHDYYYDNARRLVRTVAKPSSGWTVLRDEYVNLDAVGNRRSVSGSGSDLGGYTMDGILAEPGDRQMNQYTSTPFDKRAYDRNGNLVSVATNCILDIDASGWVDVDDYDVFLRAFDAGNLTADFDGTGFVDLDDFVAFATAFELGCNEQVEADMSYDYRNQLTEHRNISSGASTRFAYDAFGRRIEVLSNATTTPEPTRYYYDQWQAIEEQNAGNGTVATYVFGNYADEVITMRRGSDFYYHADDQFSVMAVTGPTGVVAERYEYGEYGRVQFFDAAGNTLMSSLVGNPILFTGRHFDTQTGWYDFRTRYLDSRSGRFVTRDRLGIWGDRVSMGNPLTYAAVNPSTFVDPTGESPCDNRCAIAHPFNKDRRQECVRNCPKSSGGGGESGWSGAGSAVGCRSMCWVKHPFNASKRNACLDDCPPIGNNAPLADDPGKKCRGKCNWEHPFSAIKRNECKTKCEGWSLFDCQAACERVKNRRSFIGSVLWLTASGVAFVGTGGATAVLGVGLACTNAALGLGVAGVGVTMAVMNSSVFENFEIWQTSYENCMEECRWQNL
jgi:RHS repeat-associated protein